ncbi:50S ribosomal protein L37ae [Candidatus Woesearchaeota archaeon]|nr:50S ribosomal protein L37ae [Candidatus Woesearchaeota archaeon]
MAKKSKLGSAKRFGVRYGRTVKHNLAKIEAMQRASTKCPFCLYDKVKRVAMGIFVCHKCDAKFTGRAYQVAPIKPVIQEKQEHVIEFVEEEPEDEDLE